MLFASKAAENITGYKQEEILGNTPRLWGGLMSHKFYIDFWKKIKSGESFDGEIINRRKNGEVYYAIAHIDPIFGENKEIIGYIGTEEDISKLIKIDQAKSEFVSLASHQLRTPLTGIEWTIELFARKEQLTEEGKQYLKDIKYSTQRMSMLVKLLLNVSRIESGRIGVNPEPLDIVEFINIYLHGTIGLSQNKKVSLVFLKHPQKLNITTDKNMIGYIVQNLITNAIEYTSADGNVEIILEENKDFFTLEVKDTGIGIPKEEQKNIFRKFVRASNAVTAKTDGNGLGLYIVAEAVKLLGGKISFKSPTIIQKDSEGKEVEKGTMFIVQLPLVAQAQKGEKGVILQG